MDELPTNPYVVNKTPPKAVHVFSFRPFPPAPPHPVPCRKEKKNVIFHFPSFAPPRAVPCRKEKKTALRNFRFFQKMSPRKTFSPRKIIFAKSSETRFPKVSRRAELSSGGKRPFKIFDFSKKCPPEKIFRLGRSFLQNLSLIHI